MEHVSDTLKTLQDALAKARISDAVEISFLVQYVTDHNDKEAYRQIDRQVNRLAKAWDRMIAHLEKWTVEAQKIESSCENFYGD